MCVWKQELTKPPRDLLSTRIGSMASSSGDEETSIETLSPVFTRQVPRQEPVLTLVSMPTTGYAAVGLRPAARPDRVVAQNGDWSQYKPLLKRLYMDEKKTLAQVQEHMRTQYNFDASWV